MNNSIIHYNKDLLLERIDNDLEFLGSLMAKVNETIGDDLESLKKALETKNMKVIISAAHKLKGTANTVCFDHLTFLTNTIESKPEFNETVLTGLVTEVEEEIKLLKTLTL